MPARKKTLTQLALSGALAKDTKRHADDLGLIDPKVPNCGPLGDPPPHMTEYETSVWREIEGTLIPGLLTGAHRIAFEQLVKLTAMSRTDPDMSDGKLRMLHALYVQFAATPMTSQRLNLGVEKAVEENPFNEFLPKPKK